MNFSNRNNNFIDYEKLCPIDPIKKVNVPEKMYRFIGARFLDDLMVDGRLQIKHLGAYCESELGNRADYHEGKSSGLMANGKNNIYTVIAMDAYILCLSRHPYKHLAHKFSDDNKPAVCVEIANPGTFIEKLDRTVRAHFKEKSIVVNASVSDEVAYYSPKHISEKDLNPYSLPVAMRKPLGRVGEPFYYAEETEYRILWDMGNRAGLRNPILVESKELVSHLRVVPEDELLELKTGDAIDYRILHSK